MNEGIAYTDGTLTNISTCCEFL